MKFPEAVSAVDMPLQIVAFAEATEINAPLRTTVVSLSKFEQPKESV